METADINCKHKTSNGISKLDIFEWSIELRENDLTMDEQNVMKKEIIVGRQLEEILSIKKAKDDLNIREIEIEEEFQTLKEKRQDILTNEPNESIFFSFDCGENIGISYRFYEKTQGVLNVLHIRTIFVYSGLIVLTLDTLLLLFILVCH